MSPATAQNKNHPAATARWIEYTLKIDHKGNDLPANTLKGQFLSNERIPGAGLTDPQPISKIPVFPADGQSPRGLIPPDEWANTKARDLRIGFISRNSGREMIIHNDALPWAARFEESSPVIKDKLNKAWNENTKVTELSLAVMSPLLKHLGFYWGGYKARPTAETQEILKAYFTAATMPLTRHPAQQCGPGAQDDPVAPGRDKWAWPTLPTKEDGTALVPVVGLMYELDDADREEWFDNLLSKEDITQAIRTVVEDDHRSNELHICIPGIIMPGDAAAEEANARAEDKVQERRDEAIADTLVMLAIVRNTWDAPNPVDAALRKDDQQAAELRHSVLVVGVQLALYGQETPALREHRKWYDKTFPDMAIIIFDMVMDFLERPPSAYNATPLEFLYPRNITQVQKGKPRLEEITGMINRKGWKFYLTTKPTKEPSNPLFSGILECFEAPVLTPAGDVANMANSSPAVAAAMQILIAQGYTTGTGTPSTPKDRDGNKFLLDSEWNVISQSNECAVDLDEYFTKELEAEFPRKHLVRRVLAANGFLHSRDLCVPDYTGQNFSDKLKKITRDSLRFREDHTEADKTRTVTFADRLLYIIAGRPRGRFNFDQDFRGIDVPKVLTAMRKIRTGIIRDPDMVDGSGWFKRPEQGHLAAHKVYDDAMSLKVVQVLAIGGKFAETSAMLLYRESIRNTVDCKTQQSAARDYKLCEHLVYFCTRGFSCAESPFPSYQSYIDGHMNQVQHRRTADMFAALSRRPGPYTPPPGTTDNQLTGMSRTQRRKASRLARLEQNPGGFQTEDQDAGNGKRGKGAGKKGNRHGSGNDNNNDRPEWKGLPWVDAAALSTVDLIKDNVPKAWHTDFRRRPAHYGASHSDINEKGSGPCPKCNKNGHGVANCSRFFILKKYGKDACKISDASTPDELMKAWHTLRAYKSVPSSQ